MTTMPRVLNYKAHGIPDGAVYIGRANGWYRLKRSKWANPFVDRHGTHEEIIERFKRWFYATPDERAAIIAEFKLPRSWLRGVSVGPLIDDVRELRGLDLVCWCKPLPCHGDVLLRLANA